MAPTTEPLPELAAFHRSIGTAFTARGDGGVETTLTLVEVTARPAPEGWERFSLLFAGPDPVRFDLGALTVHHDEMGTFLLAVNPVQAAGDCPHYEAVFARPAPDRITD